MSCAVTGTECIVCEKASPDGRKFILIENDGWYCCSQECLEKSNADIEEQKKIDSSYE